MRVTITCEDCGHKHRLERRISEPGPIHIVCHSCELPLQAVLEGQVAQTEAQPVATAALWAGLFSFTDPKAVS